MLDVFHESEKRYQSAWQKLVFASEGNLVMESVLSF